MIFDPEKRPVFVLADGTTVQATGVTIHGTGIEGTIVSVIVEGVEYALEARPSNIQSGNLFDMHADDTIHIMVGEDHGPKPAPPKGGESSVFGPIATHEGWQDKDGYEWAPEPELPPMADLTIIPIDDEDEDDAIDQFESM